MKYEEQFFSTYENVVRSIDADFEISDVVDRSEREESSNENADTDYDETILILSASSLILETHHYSYGEESGVSQVIMDSGREGIAKLMFHYEIPTVHNDKEFDGGAMLETLFDKLSNFSVADLAGLLVDLNISFTYKA